MVDKGALAPSKKNPKLDAEYNERNLRGDRNSPQPHIKELSVIIIALRWQKFVCYGGKEAWVEIMLHIILSVPLVSVPERLGAHGYLHRFFFFLTFRILKSTSPLSLSLQQLLPNFT